MMLIVAISQYTSLILLKAISEYFSVKLHYIWLFECVMTVQWVGLHWVNQVIITHCLNSKQSSMTANVQILCNPFCKCALRSSSDSLQNLIFLSRFEISWVCTDLIWHEMHNFTFMEHLTCLLARYGGMIQIIGTRVSYVLLCNTNSNLWMNIFPG